jgi:glutaredoxin-like protein
MVLLTDQNKKELKRRFRKDLKKEILFSLFTTSPSLLTIPGRECHACPQAQEFLEEICALSPKIDLKIYDYFDAMESRHQYYIDKIPAIVTESDGANRLVFYGIPQGYQFPVFLEAMERMSRDVSSLANTTRKGFSKIDKLVVLRIFVSSDSATSASVAKLAQAAALENRFIRAEIIDVNGFPELRRAYNVSTVPKTIINDIVHVDGMISEAMLLEKILASGITWTETAD